MIIRSGVVLVWVGCFLFFSVNAQVLESNSVGDRNFAFQVKHLEEFFERFNDVKTTYLAQYIKNKYPGVSIDRPTLIKGLFNNEEKNWDTDQLNEFVNQVTDSVTPILLDFYSGEWFAETLCKCIYKGKVINVRIILKILGNEHDGSKWLLESAHAADIDLESDSMPSGIILRSKKFINPLSHITYFAGMTKALNDRKHIYDYLDSGFISSSSSRKFLNVLLRKKLTYEYVKKITFHFLQIDGWVFTVNEFNRESVNSGWLISSMQKALPFEKITYKEKLLQ
jgi:hypothetical protein